MKTSSSTSSLNSSSILSDTLSRTTSLSDGWYGFIFLRIRSSVAAAASCLWFDLADKCTNWPKRPAPCHRCCNVVFVSETQFHTVQQKIQFPAHRRFPHSASTRPFPERMLFQGNMVESSIFRSNCYASTNYHSPRIDAKHCKSNKTEKAQFLRTICEHNFLLLFPQRGLITRVVVALEKSL